MIYLAHLSRRLKCELIVYHSRCRLCVSVCVCVCVCVSLNIFKLEYLRNQWANRSEILSERGKAAFGFGPDRIGTLVSMATDSSK